MTEPTEPRFSWWLLLRLCTFQIGSAMGDILVTSIWNRIMIVNFGFPAFPVGLLIALRYLLSPLSLYAGFRSDRTPILGLRRTSYIWLGRASWSSRFRCSVSASPALTWRAAMPSAGSLPLSHFSCTAQARCCRAARSSPSSAIPCPKRGRGWRYPCSKPFSFFVSPSPPFRLA